MPAEITLFNPDSMGKPLGQHSQITRVKNASEWLSIAGQLATDKAGTVVGGDDFDVQCVQVFRTSRRRAASGGAGWKNVVQFTTYLVHSQDIPKFMAFRKREFPQFFPDGNYPPNTLLMIDRLVGEPFLIEVQPIAAV